MAAFLKFLCAMIIEYAIAILLSEQDFYIKSIELSKTLRDYNLNNETLVESINKRCPYICMRDILRNIKLKNDSYPNILVHTPCFDVDSVGNRWSDYIEARLCANLTGLHYVAISKTCCVPIEQNIFHDIVPSTVYNKQNSLVTYDQIAQICKCGSSCHHFPEALMHSHMDMARDLFIPSVEAHLATMKASYKYLEFDPNVAWKQTLRGIESHVPIIPDAVVHYRCGDNTVGDYSFLPFKAYRDKIPLTVGTIYVLSDDIHRKTKPHQQVTCNAILSALHEYLAEYFPSARILTLRGMNPFDDLVRLTYATTIICSVSTYCLWPAISNTNTVYYPKTILIADNQQPYYTPHFHWFNDSKLLFGSNTLFQDPEHVVNILKSD